MYVKSRPFDPANYLKKESDRALYMNECLETGDPAFIADGLGVIARSRGMTQIAKEAEVSRESLYKSLSKKGNPEFATILKLMAALDLTLCVKQKRKSKAKVAVKSATKSTAKSSVKSPAKRPVKQPTQAAHPA